MKRPIDTFNGGSRCQTTSLSNSTFKHARVDMLMDSGVYVIQRASYARWIQLVHKSVHKFRTDVQKDYKIVCT